MHWREPVTLAQASEILGVKPRTVQSWAPFVPGERITGGAGKGVHRRFSFEGLMLMATAKAMIDAAGGMDLQTAFNAARTFAHYGEGGKSPEWDNGFSTDDPRRAPSFPYFYTHGDTFLAASGERSEVVLARQGGDTLSTILHELRPVEAVILVNVTDLFFRVNAARGFAPVEMMREEYSEDAAKGAAD